MLVLEVSPASVGKFVHFLYHRSHGTDGTVDKKRKKIGVVCF